METKFIDNPHNPARIITKEVMIGDVPLGGKYPIRIQSMTSVSTLDTDKTIAQCLRMIHAGVDYIRFTAPNIKEAKNLALIKEILRNKGYHTPLIADIHFNPRAAEFAAGIVDKVRINPGNFISSKLYREQGSDAVREALIPLIKICKDHGTAMRIGINHGSLSEVKLEEYGDTPRGMVFSALEYLEICEEQNFDQLVFSMKASNTRVVVYAYRLLVQKMVERGVVYPIHLGVTEAGEGEDGRIKSAIGIGALLADGIGDTVRISLTEEPEIEVPVAKKLVGYFEELMTKNPPVINHNYPNQSFEYQKRKTLSVANIGGKNVPVVIADLSEKKDIKPTDLFEIGYVYKNKKWIKKDQAADYLFLGDLIPEFPLPEGCKGILNYATWNSIPGQKSYYPMFPLKTYISAKNKSDIINFVLIDSRESDPAKISLPEDDTSAILVLKGQHYSIYDFRKWFASLIASGATSPVIFNGSFFLSDPELIRLGAAAELGSFFIDGLGDGIWLNTGKTMSNDEILSLSFGILQGSRVRTTKTEFVSCPSCGRTLFNIQEVANKVRKRTSHLKGLRIAIMGCIVNGPGEMADSDYGYVGAGPGKISLYKNHEIVKKNLPAEIAVEELVQLIKENGDWVEPFEG